MTLELKDYKFIIQRGNVIVLKNGAFYKYFKTLDEAIMSVG